MIRKLAILVVFVSVLGFAVQEAKAGGFGLFGGPRLSININSGFDDFGRRSFFRGPRFVRQFDQFGNEFIVDRATGRARQVGFGRRFPLRRGFSLRLGGGCF